jgi:hypothetical protein
MAKSAHFTYHNVRTVRFELVAAGFDDWQCPGVFWVGGDIVRREETAKPTAF